jgi:uncharacterized membrane protein YraQ (UPF0718 family)
MIHELTRIVDFVVGAFLHIWPLLLITVPLAVAVNLSGAARWIEKALRARPIAAIFLATTVGAFSPFCSCSVIPMVAALLLGGVPLPPVMAFWIASPSMDPEIFFLSVATIGWDLALWRLGSALLMSLGAGFFTQLAVQQSWLGTDFLRGGKPGLGFSLARSARAAARRLWTTLMPVSGWALMRPQTASGETRCAQTVGLTAVPGWPEAAESKRASAESCGRGSTASAAVGQGLDEVGSTLEPQGCPSSDCGSGEEPFRRRLLRETGAAVLMVGKFMTLAFVLEALMILYLPAEWITSLLGSGNPLAILTAALIGIPVYTSNLAALPMAGGLLAQGMSPAAALAFLMAGPTTTIPAMAAVWGVVNRRVFAVYVGCALVGAVATGYAYLAVAAL